MPGLFLVFVHNVILCDFFRMRLFYPFTRDRHRKVIGPCWYGQDTCSEQFLRVSDLNEARSEAKQGPKKVVFKTPGKHFSMHS